MTGEPNPGFSNKAGGMNPPGMYCYPPGFGGSTEDKPVCIYIPYPYTGAGQYNPSNPGDLPNDTN